MSNQLPLFEGSVPTTPRIVASFGLGVDSTYVILRWLTEPSSRSFDLDDLVVVTSMVGDEWGTTARDVEQHILPLFAEHRVRYIQVGRSRRNVTKDGDGVVILDDSRTPARLHIEGDYKLSTELLTAATVPQLGGAHRCSIKSKAAVLQPVIERITAGQPYLHMLGFDADELPRSRKDSLYNSETRRGWYPMQEWGTDRRKAREYIRTVLGVDWNRSACTFCPFALATEKGRAATLSRYRDEPTAAVDALVIEATSVAVNERQGLLGQRRLADILAAAGMTEILTAAEDRLHSMPHAIYEVRRIVPARAADPTKAGPVWRSVVRRATGARTEMDRALTAMPGRAVTSASGVTRMVVRSREDHPGFPQLEHFYVVAPAVVEDKARPGFEVSWRAATESQQLF